METQLAFHDGNDVGMSVADVDDDALLPPSGVQRQHGVIRDEQVLHLQRLEQNLQQRGTISMATVWSLCASHFVQCDLHLDTWNQTTVDSDICM